MLQDDSQLWKDQKRERLQERFEKIVQGIWKRHDKMVEKGCTFEKINRSAGRREHFVNHGNICESMGAYFKGKRWFNESRFANLEIET